MMPSLLTSKNTNPVLARVRAGTGLNGPERREIRHRSTPRPSLEGVLCGNERTGLLARDDVPLLPGARAPVDFVEERHAARRTVRCLSQWRGRAGFTPASNCLARSHFQLSQELYHQGTAKRKRTIRTAQTGTGRTVVTLASYGWTHDTPSLVISK